MGYTPLLLAAHNGHTSTVELLLSKGAKYDINNPEHASALTGVLYDGSYKTIVDAAANNDRNGVQFFLDHGISVNQVDENNKTPLMNAAFKGHQNMMDILYEQSKNKLFKKVINKISLSGHENIKLKIEEMQLDQLGALLTYTTNHNEHFTWDSKEDEVKKALGLKNIRLIDNHDGKYLVQVYSDSLEAKVVKDLVVKNHKPEFVNFIEENHTTYLLFKNKAGTTLENWEDQRVFIEHTLKIPVDIQKYDHSHELWGKFGDEELIMIAESIISVMPDKLKLGGVYLKTNDENGVQSIYFKDVSNSDKWMENQELISEFVGMPMELDIRKDGIVILREPSVPSIEDGIKSVQTKNISKDQQLFLGIKDRGAIEKIYTDKNKQTKNKVSGSILVSGESGSGKTFTINNLIRQYLYDYESLDQIVIFNFKSDAGFDWLKQYSKVKIVDGNNSVQTILREFMLVQLRMNTKYAYNKFHGVGAGKENFQENYNSLIIIDEAQTIPNKIETSKGQEYQAYDKISKILEDIASKIRATGDSLLISTQFPKNSNIPGGGNVRDNLRHKFCGKGKFNDISQAIEADILLENKVETHNLTLGQMLYYDSLTGRFEKVFVQLNELTSDDEKRLLEYQETEHNNALSKKLDTLKDISIRADKLQQEMLDENDVLFDNLEDAMNYEEVDVFELAREQLEDEKSNPSNTPVTNEQVVDKKSITVDIDKKEQELPSSDFDFDSFLSDESEDEEILNDEFDELDDIYLSSIDILKELQKEYK